MPSPYLSHFHSFGEYRQSKQLFPAYYYYSYPRNFKWYCTSLLLSLCLLMSRLKAYSNKTTTQANRNIHDDRESKPLERNREADTQPITPFHTLAPFRISAYCSTIYSASLRCLGIINRASRLENLLRSSCDFDSIQSLLPLFNFLLRSILESCSMIKPILSLFFAGYPRRSTLLTFIAYNTQNDPEFLLFLEVIYHEIGFTLVLSHNIWNN